MKKLTLFFMILCLSSQIYTPPKENSPKRRLELISDELESNFDVDPKITTSLLPLILSYLASIPIHQLYQTCSKKTFLDTACPVFTTAATSCAISCFLNNNDDHATKMLLVALGIVGIYAVEKTDLVPAFLKLFT